MATLIYPGRRKERAMQRWLAGILWFACASAAHGAVLQVGELNATRIATLDRSRTVVILVGGILEQHRPWLPAYTDGYASERLAAQVAEAVGARVGWTALVFPQIPLGSSGANDIGGRYVFPGTYVLRSETLRSVYMDLADQLGEPGFRWILVVHLHGAPLQNRMLDDAADYFRDTHGGGMLHLYGLMKVLRAWGEGSATLAPDLAAAERYCVHVCIDETSVVLQLRPELVDPGFRNATPLTGADIRALREIASKSGWPGYFGTPQHARPEFGRAVLDALAREMIAAATDLLDGHEERLGPRFADIAWTDATERTIDAAALVSDDRIAARQRAWLAVREGKRREPPASSAPPGGTETHGNGSSAR
jgi:creatinine amidohydrolase/Fe(II)-dependent formamide hydrolase-like protein